MESVAVAGGRGGRRAAKLMGNNAVDIPWIVSHNVGMRLERIGIKSNVCYQCVCNSGGRGEWFSVRGQSALSPALEVR